MTGAKHNHTKANHHQFTDSGSGPAIVIITGLPGTGEWFEYQSAGLADRYRVLVCDWPSSLTANYDLAQLQASVLGAMEDAGVRSAAIVGYQLGAPVALKIAVEHPARTAALILASPIPGPFYRNEGELGNYLSPIGVVSEGILKRILDPVKKLLGIHPPEITPDEQASDEGELPAVHMDIPALKSILKDFGKVDERPLAASVEMPTLVVAGSKEPEFMLSAAGFLAQSIDDSEVEIIEGADSRYFYTMNDRFNNLIQDFLTRRVASF